MINYTFERPKVQPSSPPVYADVVAEHLQFFRRRIHMAMAEGMARDQLMLDPGIAFGKSHDEDLVVLRRLRDFAVLGLPLLVAAPRKHFIGSVLGGAAGGPGRRHGCSDRHEHRKWCRHRSSS